MRILYFHQHFSTPAGSTGTRSYEMAQALVVAGHEVHMICGSYHSGNTGLVGEFRKGRRSGAVEGIHVTELELEYSNHDSFLKRTGVFIKFAFRSVGIALKEPCDLVFATSTPLTAGIPGIFARWLRGRRFVFEVRDLWPELPREMGVITNPVVLGLMSVLEWMSYRSAHACIGLSPGIVEGIRRRSSANKPVAMIPNGCDIGLFSRKGVSAIRPNGLESDDLMAIFTGAHGIANGLDAVLDAASILKQRGRKDIKIVFIGDGKLKPALIERAEHETLDNCLFLDPVPKTELLQYLLGADIGLMILDNIPAFYFGTSPNKFFDYIAVGLPVLNNYPGWLAEIITSNHLGYAVPPGDADAFAEALENAADNRDGLVEMGSAGKTIATEEFSRKKLSKEFVGFLEKQSGCS